MRISMKFIRNYGAAKAGEIRDVHSREDAETLIADGIAKYNDEETFYTSANASRKQEMDEIVARVQAELKGERKGSPPFRTSGISENLDTVSTKDFYFGKQYSGGNDFDGDIADYFKTIALAKGGFHPRLKTLTVGDETGGGYLVPDVLYGRIYDRIRNLPTVLNRCAKFQTEGSGLKVPAVYDYDWSSGLYNMEAPPAGEDTTLSEVEPTFEQLELNLHKQGFILPVTNELLEDSRSTLSTLLPAVMSSAVSFGLDKLLINGNGASEPLGILNAPCLVTVDKEVDQDAGTIVYDNLLKMYSCLIPGADATAVWMISKSAIPWLGNLTVNVGTGGAVMWIQSAGERIPGTIFGIPVVIHPHCKTVGTEGDIILADWSAYGVLGKTGTPLVRVDFSEHIEFKKFKSVWRCVCRVDGQPLMSTTLTDTDGSTTLSHFVTLETRE